MRLAVFSLGLILSVSGAVGQEVKTNSSSLNFGNSLSQPSTNTVNDAAVNDALVLDPNVSLDKKTDLKGYLAQPAPESKSLLKIPLGIIRDLNPLAPIGKPAALPVPRHGGPEALSSEIKVKRLSPRAWTTTVGWHPGESAFPDPITAWP